MGVSADNVLERFAAEVGNEGPVSVRGGATMGDFGGRLNPGTRLLDAPTGVLQHHITELTVTVSAGMPVAELEEHLAASGQTTLLPVRPGGTVGGAVAVGHSGLHSRAVGPMRDSVLGIRAVDSSGRPVRAGGATVKNVSGFDLCRLFTGSLGTLALLAEVTLRTRPRWPAEAWLRGGCDAQVAAAVAANATAVLTDGQSSWVHLAGHHDDVAAQRRDLERAGCGEHVGGPPELPPHRWSVDPASLVQPASAMEAAAVGSWVAEIGVGVVHCAVPQQRGPLPERVLDLHREVKARFDPDGRLNPGRSPLGADLDARSGGVAP